MKNIQKSGTNMDDFNPYDKKSSKKNLVANFSQQKISRKYFGKKIEFFFLISSHKISFHLSIKKFLDFFWK